LTPEQRYALTQIPADFSDREIAPHYTFTQKDLALIRQRRQHHNRLGFAVQLAVLRFPGRSLKDLADIPVFVLAAMLMSILWYWLATLACCGSTWHSSLGGKEVSPTEISG
jgi:hypothetical protein